ncbi:hypothetical protein RCOM_0812370 [Ricinus communis]|uniref:Uncharacterized protein n=1 Tax=Ricinus communis TaxID=3988 RepID=B9RYE3_RICCO|nr:hypothetical protein RCOM_0812370 [Ricinus communis]
MDLEASGQQFNWTVRKEKNSLQEKEEWLPEGFEKTMEEKGLIIRGWAPKPLILDREAIWKNNSTMKSWRVKHGKSE